MKLLKKAQVGGMQGFILAIVTVAIVLAVGLIVLSELNTSIVEGETVTATCNRTGSGVVTTCADAGTTNVIIGKMATIPTWIGIVIIVALAFIVLSFFIGKRQ